MQTKLLHTTAAVLAAMLISAGPSAAQTRTTLDIYVIDVEGGNATLFVAPSGTPTPMSCWRQLVHWFFSTTPMAADCESLRPA